MAQSGMGLGERRYAKFLKEIGEAAEAAEAAAAAAPAAAEEAVVEVAVDEAPSSSNAVQENEPAQQVAAAPKKPRRKRNVEKEEVAVVVKKRAVGPKAEEVSFFEKLMIYNAILFFASALRSYPGTVTEDARKIVRKWMGPHLENMCLEVVISLSMKLPDRGNFRRLNSYFEDLLFKKNVMSVQILERLRKQRAAKRIRAAKPRCFVQYSSTQRFADDATGGMIVEMATLNGNHAYTNRTRNFHLPSLSDALVALERKVYSQLGWKREEGKDACRMPTPVIELANVSDEEMDILKEVTTGVPIAVLRGVSTKFGLDYSKFQIQELARLFPNQKITTYRQYGQPTSSNKSVMKTNGDTWPSKTISQEVSLEEFASNYMKLQQISHQGLENLMRNGDHAEEILEDMKQKFIANQIELEEEGKKLCFPGAGMLSFGSNIDMDDKRRYANQMIEINKLPAFIHPEGHGNLMNHAKTIIQGLNRVQLYAKPPAVRTHAHLENQALGSININLGPGDCIWYAVPFEFVDRLCELVHSKGLWHYSSSYWPNEEELLEMGIPLQKFIQRPDDLVYVGTGTHHWVQSVGFCTNIAWNVAQPNATQLAAAMVTHDHMWQWAKPAPIMPIEQILWEMARKKEGLETEMFEYIKMALAKSLAHCAEENEYLESHNFVTRKMEEHEDHATVNRCRKADCGAILFNVFASEIIDGEDTIFCLLHHNTKKENTYWKRNDIATLVKIYDDYVGSRRPLANE